MNTIDVIALAIMDDQRIRVAYHKPEAKRPEVRDVSPYELRDAANGAELLVGWDHDREGMRSFRLDRIEDAVWILDAPFREAKR